MDDRRPAAPVAGRHFLVALDDADPRAPAAGFVEVVFPAFLVPEKGDARRPGDGATPAVLDARPRLVLKRGATGALDLYRWWDAARRAPAPPRRTVTVQLLAADQATVVLAWRFVGAYPVSLAYSPLHALRDDLVIETAELAFDRVEMLDVL